MNRWLTPGAIVVGLASLGGCGGETTAARRDAGATTVVERDANATTEDASVELDAGSDAACAELADAAWAGFEPVLNEHLGCQVDTDCLWTSLGSPGWCIAVCGVLTDKAGVGAVTSAAANLCEPFNAQGCPTLGAGCPAGPPLICAEGTCTAYTIDVAQVSPSLVAGECAVFRVSYHAVAGSPEAPHDIAVTLMTGGGALYADEACKTPLDGGLPNAPTLATGSVTIAAGSQTAPFGFEPKAAGSFWIQANYGPTTSFTAQ
jgi:hypothetical protein